MAVSSDFTQYVVDQLSELGRVRPSRLFGGVGLYSGDAFFALIFSETLYFKVNDSNRADYLACGAARFQPSMKRPQLSLSYYAVPVEVLEDPHELANWARQSVQIAKLTGARRRSSTAQR